MSRSDTRFPLSESSPLRYNSPAGQTLTADVPSRNGSGGFSLMEVLVTLVLFSIVSGVAVVSLGPLWQKHQLKQATGQLLSQIQTCRMKAIVEQKTYQIKISKQTLSSRYKSGIDWSDWEEYRFPGSALYSMSGTSYFYSKGFASPKTITVVHDNYQQKVIININGRARTSEIY